MYKRQGHGHPKLPGFQAETGDGKFRRIAGDQMCIRDRIKTLCNEAVAYKTASVCINPGHVKAAAQYLAGRIPVCTVVGFPLGATTTAAKVFEAKEAIENGASEIDMVINIGALKAVSYTHLGGGTAVPPQRLGGENRPHL